jgi:hypothetical protein
VKAKLIYAISVGKQAKKAHIWHEMGYLIENTVSAIKAAALALLKSRHATAVKKPIIEKLGFYMGWARPNEYIVNNFVVDAYSSKFYTPSNRAEKDFDYATRTELISSGFDWLSDKDQTYKLVMDKELHSIILAAVATLNGRIPA